MSLPPTQQVPTGRVLVVDDAPSMLRSLAAVINARVPEIEVATSSSAKEALGKLREVDFDVVLTDVVMPEMDGIALLECARLVRADSVFIIISGVEATDTIRRALRGGAYDFLLKPVDPEHVEASLRRALETRQLRREVEDHQRELRRHAESLERAMEARIRELREANRSKDEFLATLSHELRTPLTAILGWARLIKSSKLDRATTEQAIDSIARNAALQGQLIDDLLDVSNIVAGKLRLQTRQLDVAAILGAAVDAILPSAKGKGTRVETQIPPDIGTIVGDPERLIQVCWNLLSNAVKFTSASGDGVVGLSARRTDDQIEIVVSDNGIGIDPSFLPFVFDRFRQGDGAGQSARRGLGLGLAVARHLVELHQGTIEVTSDGQGRGAQFVVRLPVGEEAPEDDRRGVRRISTSRDDIPPADLSGVRALVVDDEEDTRALLRVVLEEAGAAVRVAGSGREALQVFAEMLPDVVLCDIALPDVDGYSVIRSIRSRPVQSGGAVPAIALTAHAKAEDRTRALSAGFQIHLPKPGPAGLAAIVEELLESSWMPEMEPA